jgi:DNA polymerase III delta subunit
MQTPGWGRRRWEFDAFIKGLTRLGPPSSILISGPELLLRDEILVRLRKTVLDEAADDARWGRETRSARESPLSEISSMLREVGLFADTRLVIVRDVERYGRVGQADRAEFWQCLEHPSPGVHLALVSEKPLWEIERGSEFLKGTLQKVDAVVRCDHPTPQGAALALARIGKDQYGLEIPSEVAARIVEAIGPNLLELKQEIQRLALRVGPGAKIDETVLVDWLRGGVVGSVGEMEEAILRKDCRKALRTWDSVRRDVTVPAITWMIGNRHLDPRWGRSGGQSIISQTHLSRVLHECYLLERGVKTGEIPATFQEIAFEAMIWRLCTEGLPAGGQATTWRAVSR